MSTIDFEKRKWSVGSSDAPVIMEVSPWKTPVQLWSEKLGLAESLSTPWMKRGNALEEEARQAFEKETGIVVFPALVESKELPWMTANLDGISLDEKTLVELKCPGEEDHKVAEAGKIPNKYFPQLQHQLSLTNLESGYYASYRRNCIVLVKIYRDDKYIKLLIDKERKFYECMMTFEPPELTERDYQIKEDDEWKALANEYKSLATQQEELEQKQKTLKDSLISLAGQSNCKGAGISVARVLKKGCVDYTKIPELQMVDLNQYRKKPSSYWMVR